MVVIMSTCNKIRLYKLCNGVSNLLNGTSNPSFLLLNLYKHCSKGGHSLSALVNVMKNVKGPN
jgi:hypothetical protein